MKSLNQATRAAQDSFASLTEDFSAKVEEHQSTLAEEVQKYHALLTENDKLRELNLSLEGQLKKDGVAIEHANKEINALKDKYQL